MPKYVVQIAKREIVVLVADVEIDADSAYEARLEVQRLEREDEIDDRLWYEDDVSYVDEPAEIKDVYLDDER